METGFIPAPAKPVGFANFDLTDASRFDSILMSHRRKINVSVWYPAETNDPKHRKKYYDDNDCLGRNQFFNTLYGSARQVAPNLWTNSYHRASVSERRDRYPVLLFSHDLGTVPNDYTALMEHLASEGYFIFSINHSSSWGDEPTSQKQAVRFFKYWKNLKVQTKAKVLLWNAKRNLIGKTYEEKWTWCRTNLHLWNGLKKTYEEILRDRSFLLDFLVGMGSTLGFDEYPYRLFAQRLDLQNIGAVGHGWGGAAAIDSLVSDKRTIAALNLDGFQFSQIKDKVIEKPMFMIYSQEYTGINAGIYFNASDADIHTISGTKHASFSDAPFFRKDQAHNQYVIYDLATLAVNFFDRHLKKVDHLMLSKHLVKQSHPTIL